MMIEVFKTNIKGVRDARKIVLLLLQHFPACRINVDLHDCDRILRVEGRDYSPGAIIRLVTISGYNCSLLE